MKNNYVNERKTNRLIIIRRNTLFRNSKIYFNVENITTKSNC